MIILSPDISGDFYLYATFFIFPIEISFELMYNYKVMLMRKFTILKECL